MRYDNDPDWSFKKGGIKAVEQEAKARVRFIGSPGRTAHFHLKMLSNADTMDAPRCPVQRVGSLYRSSKAKECGLLGQERWRDGMKGRAAVHGRKFLPKMWA